MKKCYQCKKQLDDCDFIKNEKDHKVCNKCREYASVYYKQCRANNPEKYKAKDKKYRYKNIDKIREKDKKAHQKYRDMYPEEYKNKRIAYQEKNYDKMKAHDIDRAINRPEYFLFSSARIRARKSNLEFSITEQDIKNIMNISECPLRKTSFKRGSNHKACDDSMSLDRIDSTKGYTKDNIQIISYRANVSKNNVDLKTFKKIIEGYENFKLETHDIDDNSWKIIIEDRLDQIKKDNREEKDYRRLLNIEKYLLMSAKKRIKKTNLNLDIDIDYIKSIWPLDNKCPILKEKFVFGKNVSSNLSATIDRFDNSKGYIKGNIMIVSARANSVKNKCTLKELKLMCENWENLESSGK